MKGPRWLLRLTICASFLCAFAASLRADLFVLWPSAIFRYDEKTGALIDKHYRDFNTETVDSIAAAPNGDFFALGNLMGWGGVFRLDGITGEYKQTVVDHSGIFMPYRVGFGPDGDLFIASKSGGIGRYDPATGEFKGTFLSKEKMGDANSLMTFGPDGNIYLAAPAGIARYSAITGEYIDLFAPLDTNILVMTFCFDHNDNFYLLSGNGRIYRRDPASQQMIQFTDIIQAGMHASRIMIPGPDGDIYVGDADTYRNKTPLDVWKFDGHTGASKGIFIHGETPPYGDGWIEAMIFSGPRLHISHGANGPCLKWPNTHGAFELQTCAGLNQPWQKVQEAPTTTGCSQTLNLPPTVDTSLFRLIKQ